MDMEFEIGRSRVGSGVDWSEDPPKSKSALRMIYAAETQVFKAQHGNLEEIRQKLGFSRRKMCQLLLVDPSAWTRWCKDESKVPPHIYRALEWFLALNQKALTQPDLAAVFSHRYRAQVSQQDGRVQTLIEELKSLQGELVLQRRISWFLCASLMAVVFTLAILVVS